MKALGTTTLRRLLKATATSRPCWFKLRIRLLAPKTTICVLNSVGSPIDAAKRQAAVVVARSILVIAYHILRDGTEYQELGVDYLDKPNKEQATHRLVKRLEQLGHQVSLDPAPA